MIWLHGIRKDENVIKLLFEALVAIDRRNLAGNCFMHVVVAIDRRSLAGNCFMHVVVAIDRRSLAGNCFMHVYSFICQNSIDYSLYMYLQIHVHDCYSHLHNITTKCNNGIILIDLNTEQ